jgi:uncharacterized protein YlaI
VNYKPIQRFVCSSCNDDVKRDTRLSHVDRSSGFSRLSETKNLRR